MNSWHRESEKKPEGIGLVLMCYLDWPEVSEDSTSLGLGYVDVDGRWRDDEGDTAIRPLYWMPLPPAPPREEIVEAGRVKARKAQAILKAVK